MLEYLKQAHEALLGCISELEAVLAGEVLDASTLARIRLQLSKASSQRRKIVTEAIQRLSESANPSEAARLDLLRKNAEAMLAATSSHVGEWSIDAILADNDGYRAASATMRKAMRERIATERAVLYPLLERADGQRY